MSLAENWAFVSSAACDLHTKASNAAVYARVTLRPRILRDVDMIDTTTHFLGHKLCLPLFTSPTAMAGLIHPEGERRSAEPSRPVGIAQCISMSASYPLKDIVEEIRCHPVSPPYEVPSFFQFYVNKNRAHTKRLLQEAKERDVSALFLTVDAARTGKREATERIQVTSDNLTLPASGITAANDAKGGGLGRSLGSFIDSSVTWDDLAWIKKHASGTKLLLKGIQTHEDALMEAQAGLDGIVISNHGGRTLDTAPATLLVLLELHKHCPEVFSKLEVMIDGGISRGTDVFKALCLGTKAVGLGRATLYGLCYGYEGTVKVFESKWIDLLPI